MVILIRRGVDQVERAKAALDRQRRKADRILQRIGSVLLDLEIAYRWSVIEHAVGLQFLIQRHGFDRPVVAQLPGNGGAAAVVIGVVVIVLDEGVVVDRLADRNLEAAGCAGGRGHAIYHADAAFDRLGNQQRVAGGQTARAARIPRHAVGACHVIDIAALVIAVERQADAQLIGHDRDVDEAIDTKAGRAAFGSGGTAGKAGMKAAQIGLVGDVTDCPAHCVGAEQCALRAGQHFDAIKVSGANIEVTARGRCGGIVDIQRDVRLHPGHAQDLRSCSVGRQAADIDRGNPRPARSGAHVGKIFDQLFKIGDVKLFELFPANCVDRHRDAVGGFGTAGRGHDDIGHAAA